MHEQSSKQKYLLKKIHGNAEKKEIVFLTIEISKQLRMIGRCSRNINTNTMWLKCSFWQHAWCVDDWNAIEWIELDWRKKQKIRTFTI